MRCRCPLVLMYSAVALAALDDLGVAGHDRARSALRGPRRASSASAISTAPPSASPSSRMKPPTARAARAPHIARSLTVPCTASSNRYRAAGEEQRRERRTNRWRTPSRAPFLHLISRMRPVVQSSSSSWVAEGVEEQSLDQHLCVSARRRRGPGHSTWSRRVVLGSGGIGQAGASLPDGSGSPVLVAHPISFRSGSRRRRRPRSTPWRTQRAFGECSSLAELRSTRDGFFNPCRISPAMQKRALLRGLEARRRRTSALRRIAA